MDRRTLIAVLLSVTIYWTWLAFFAPPPPLEEELPPSEAGVSASAPPVAPLAPVAAAGVDQRSPFRGCGLEAEVGTTSGLSRLVLPGEQAPYQVQPIWSWLIGQVIGSGQGPWLPYGPDPGPERMLTADARGLVLVHPSGAPVPLAVRSAAPDRVELAGTWEGLQVQQTWRVEGEGTPNCQVKVDLAWSGGSPQLVLADSPPPGVVGRYDQAVRPVALVDGALFESTTDELLQGERDAAVSDGWFSSGERAPSIEVGWFGLADRYFGLLVVPERPLGDLRLFAEPGPNGPRFGHRGSLGAEQGSLSLRIFAGPLRLDVLPMVHPQADVLVSLGWFAMFAYPLLWLLRGLQAALGNWGVSIIALTVLVKILFFPLTQSSFKSSQAMQVLQPRLTEIRERFKDDPERMNRETMQLFQTHGVNPLGGCLPMLVQIPVWIALFNVLLTSVELYHTRFLYLEDLSKEDPYGILPLLVVGMMFLQQSMTPMPNLDPAQARVLKLMPLFFGVLYFTFPSGLAIYTLSNVTLSLLQQWWIKRTYQAPNAVAA